MKTRVIVLLSASTLVLLACGRSGSATSNGTDSNESNPSLATPPADDAQKYSAPWKQSSTMIVIDAYEGNAINWTQMASDPRVVGVVHRATEGSLVDSLYKSRAVTAAQHGYLWGAYHLGKSGDPIAQAQLYLSTIGDPTNILMALDLEDTSAAGMMNIANAKIFLNYVFEKTGRMPVVYANNNVTQAINDAMKGDATFAQTRLWYARFVSTITSFPKGVWSSYFLWQFSSEINCTSTGKCLYNVPGTSFDMDVDVFYGEKASLTAEWVQ